MSTSTAPDADAILAELDSQAAAIERRVRPAVSEWQMLRQASEQTDEIALDRGSAAAAAATPSAAAACAPSSSLASPAPGPSPGSSEWQALVEANERAEAATLNSGLLAGAAAPTAEPPAAAAAPPAAGAPAPGTPGAPDPGCRSVPTLLRAASQQRRLASMLPAGSSARREMEAEAEAQEALAAQLGSQAGPLTGARGEGAAAPRAAGDEGRQCAARVVGEASATGGGDDDDDGPPFVRATLRRDGEGRFKLLLREDESGVYIAKLAASDTEGDTRSSLLEGDHIRLINGIAPTSMPMDELKAYVRDCPGALHIEVFRLRPRAGGGGGFVAAERDGADDGDALGAVLGGVRDMWSGLGAGLGGLIEEVKEKPEVRDFLRKPEVVDLMGKAEETSREWSEQLAGFAGRAGQEWNRMVADGRDELHGRGYSLQQLGEDLHEKASALTGEISRNLEKLVPPERQPLAPSRSELGGGLPFEACPASPLADIIEPPAVEASGSMRQYADMLDSMAPLPAHAQTPPAHAPAPCTAASTTTPVQLMDQAVPSLTTLSTSPEEREAADLALAMALSLAEAGAPGPTTPSKTSPGAPAHAPAASPPGEVHVPDVD